MIAHSTDAGEVVAYSSHFAVLDADDKKQRRQRVVSWVSDNFLFSNFTNFSIT